MPEPEVATVDTSGSFWRVMADTIGKELPGAIAESKAQGAEMRRLGTETADRLERGQKKAEGLAAPPPPPPSPAPQMQNTSVTEQWGSVAMGLAMLGSAFTRRPAINALNAAAGVMKAYQARDADEYKRNFERWRVETDYSLKMYQYQHDAYKDALDLIGKDQNTAIAIMRTRAAALGDDPIKKLLEVGKLAEAEAILREREARIPKLEAESKRAQQEGQITGELLSAGKAMQENPNDPAVRQRYDAAQRAARDYQAATKDPAAYGGHEDILTKRRDEYRTTHEGKDPPAEMLQQWSGELKKAESTAGAHPSAEFEIVDKDGKVVERVLAREGTTAGSPPVRTDTGQPIVLAPGQTIHKAPPGTEGRQQAAQLTAIRGAGNQAVKALKNLVELPIKSNLGALMGVQFRTPEDMATALRRAAAREFTPDEVKEVSISFAGVARNLATLEAQGRATGLVGLSEQMNALAPQSGDSPLIMMRRYAEIRQIIDASIENARASHKQTPELEALYNSIQAQAAAAVPYTVSDVNDLRRGFKAKRGVSSESAKEFAEKMFAREGKPIAPPSESGKPATARAGAAAARAAPPKVGSQAEYDALPSGARFVGPDGVERAKP